MRNLVVCCDGTWNTPDMKDGGIPAPTNVYKIWGAVADQTEKGKEQRRYYHTGVGTDGGYLSRIAGGTFGTGLSKNVKSAYKWLAEEYEPKDRIFLFGFSRGAFTVRSLAGMIARCGLVDLKKSAESPDEVWACVDAIFAKYRREAYDESVAAEAAYHNAKSVGDAPGKTAVHFLGVWDTVGALGVPDDQALLNLVDDPRRYQFHDTELSATVKTARHAVAIDERRQVFAPTLWSNCHQHDDAIEIWFPGVHADVGGGYAATGLSDIALAWMIEEAEKAGLKLRDTAKQQIKGDPHGVLHDSLTGIFASDLSNIRPRAVPGFGANGQKANFHPAALARQENPPLAQPDYWRTIQLAKKKSAARDVFAGEKWNYSGIFVKKGEEYRLSATGQWIDGLTVKCGPGGTSDGVFQLGEIAHLLSSGIGKLETLIEKATGNGHANIKLTRREENLPWFSLVGAVANGRGVDDNGHARRHQIFLVGEGCTLLPEDDGYLYFFANDAWEKYENNRGSVKVVIERVK
ncbi:DUF2235 domain-containing protein [Stappia sp. F7233]|uniref:DUF2235 domain-containing protein n=1 Tax=Stappia albiluteola TaxID=2758565 RepID=A0A839AK16_9HYPH|nr:DUF2235 domain-containing protein [Stappia albiluteola]MBA5779368.1 DUF2235 domain-containing protein [Stappia albiluteola]